MEFGPDTRQRVAANVLIPLCLNTLGKVGTGSNKEVGAVMELLREMPPENNKITRKFAPLGLIAKNALQSQGLIGLYKEQCSGFRCLDCVIGKGVLGA
jgi:hypothetical protein